MRFGNCMFQGCTFTHDTKWVGYNERNIVFAKPINTDNHLLSRNWSLGTGYWTNDLRLNSNSTDNGITMEQFYIDYVYDYGTVLQDLVAKKTPNDIYFFENLNLNDSSLLS